MIIKAIVLVLLTGCSPMVSVRQTAGIVLAVSQPATGGFSICPHGGVVLYVAPGVKDVFWFDGDAPAAIGDQVSVTLTTTRRFLSCATYQIKMEKSVK